MPSQSRRRRFFEGGKEEKNDEEATERESGRSLRRPRKINITTLACRAGRIILQVVKGKMMKMMKMLSECWRSPKGAPTAHS